MSSSEGSAVEQRILDERDLVETAADFARLSVEFASARAKVVRLARRLVQDPTLTDEEVFVRASSSALRSLLEAVGRR